MDVGGGGVGVNVDAAAGSEYPVYADEGYGTADTGATLGVYDV